MSTRDPKRNYTIEETHTTSSTADISVKSDDSTDTKEHTTTANENTTIDCQPKSTDSVENQPTAKPPRKLQVRKKSHTLAELKASLNFSRSLGNKQSLIEKQEAESSRKLLEAVKADPNATLIDKSNGKPLVAKSAASKSGNMEDVDEPYNNDNVEEPVPRPFRRCPKNGVLQSLFKKMAERAMQKPKDSLSSTESTMASTDVIPVQRVPFKPITYEQPRMNIDVNFQKNITSIDNTITSIRIKHPPRQTVIDAGLVLTGKGLGKLKKNKKRRNTDMEDDDDNVNDDDGDNDEEDDEDEDEDYDPEDDDDEEDEEDEYEPPIEGLPKGVIYSQAEEKWIKEASESVQKQIVEQENKLVNAQLSETPLRFRVLQSPNLTDRSRANIIRMIDDMNECMPFGSDFNKMSQRMNLLEKIPFDNYIQPVITSKDTPEKIGNFLMGVKETMDKAVFGHTVAKQQIISILAREISNPKSVGNVFAIQGPMGNGKTTLAKEGICKAMNRPFAFISLGGMQDSSHFTGHSFTYEGSKPGRIVEILIETGCMNPVIYFDELDKVSETKHGEEIIHLLCHLTDSSQNALFQDKYFSGIELDLSKATFIFSYNDESRINPILLDRMIKIRTDGFDTDSKMVIAKNYLIPTLRTQFQFSETDVEIDDEVLRQIMSQYTQNEKGVRNLKRCLDAIMAKCNILRYIPAEQQKIMGFAVKGFKMPYKMTLESLSQFLEKDEQVNPSVAMMYM